MKVILILVSVLCINCTTTLTQEECESVVSNFQYGDYVPQECR